MFVSRLLGSVFRVFFMTRVYLKSLVNGPVKSVNLLVNCYRKARFFCAFRISLNPKKRINALASLNSHRIYKAMRISCASMRFSLMRAHMRAFNNTDITLSFLPEIIYNTLYKHTIRILAKKECLYQ